MAPRRHLVTHLLPMGVPVAYDVALRITEPQLITSVRVRVPIDAVGRAWKPALDQVWAFLKGDGTLKPGHNLFLYHHPAPRRAGGRRFGVEVERRFEMTGNVRCVEHRQAKSRGHVISAHLLLHKLTSGMRNHYRSDRSEEHTS